MYPRRSLLAYIVTTAFLAACGGDGGSSNAPTPTAPFSQTDLRTGSGREAVNGSRITVNYSGWFYDPSQAEQKGRLFDTSMGRQPYTLTLGAGQVIQGWDRGLVGMKAGGVRRLVIPPELAYGASGYGQIPPNATLVFEVELLDVE
jgi:FKBP-type peptidyl-prolyl cis-trans isomerase FkpA